MSLSGTPVVGYMVPRKLVNRVKLIQYRYSSESCLLNHASTASCFTTISTSYQVCSCIIDTLITVLNRLATTHRNAVHAST